MNPRYPRYDRNREFPVEFLLLGPLEVRDDGRVVAVGAAKQRALLAFLALHPDQVVSRDRLIDELWGGDPPATVATSLRVRVAELRRLLEPERRAGARTGVIDGRDGGYLLRVEPDAVDAFRFESLVKAAADEPPESAAAVLREALALWRGDALQDFTYEPFAQPAITRLEELRLVATKKRIDADLELGRHAELVPELEELLRHHPHRERLRAQLMLALYRSGRQGEALAAYQEGRRALLDELGVEPSDQLKELEQAILRHDRNLQLAGEAVPSPVERTELRSPYKGLRPFGEADAGDFFGRDALMEELLARLADGARFACVLGASGSGKSSVVKAGLVPALRSGALEGSEEWTYVEIMPGGQPLAELETALLRVAHNPPPSLIEQLEGDPYGLHRAVGRVLPDDGSELLLVVDQLEELFTMGADEPTRAHVLESLRLAVTHPRSRLRVVATLRADLHDRPLRYREFGALLEESTVVALPLSADELERAIAGPAEQVGAFVEPALVAEIVADLTDQPGALPLLQYALTEVFEQRETDTLTVVRYRAVGGVSGALAARAEHLYAELDDEGQRTARRLLLRLVTLGEGTEDTRRRVPRAELEALAEPTEADRLFDSLTAHRLLSTDRDPETDAATVEIAHEALLREWPRLKGWIDDDRDGLRRLRHISEAAASWQRLDRDDGELYRGARLEQALAWQEEHPEDLNPLEAQFLSASRQLRDAEQAAEQERIQQRNRQNRRLRLALAVVAVALAGAIAGAIVALDQRGEAREQANRAEAETARANQEADEAELNHLRMGAARFDAETRRLVAESVAQIQDNRRLSLLLAAQAYRLEPSVETLGALQRALTGSLGFLGYYGEGPDYQSVVLTADDRLVMASATAVEVFDTETGQLERRIEIPEGATLTELSPGGEFAAVAAADGTVRVVDTGTGEQLGAPLDSSPGPSMGMAFSSDLAHLATARADGAIVIWDLASANELHTIAAGLTLFGGATTIPLLFSPDGTLFVSGSAVQPVAQWRTPNTGVRVWDVASGRQVGNEMWPNPESRKEMADSERGTRALAFSSDGETLTTVGKWTIRRWDLETGELLSDAVMAGVDDRFTLYILDFVQLSDTTGAAVIAGGLVTVFDLRTGELVHEQIDSQLTAEVMAASADGSAYAVAGQDGAALWSTSGQQLLGDAIPRREAEYASFNADGTTLVATRAADRAIAWDLETIPPTARRFDKAGWTWYLDRGRVLVTADGFATGNVDYALSDPETFVDLGITFEHGPKLVPEKAHAGAGLLYSDADPKSGVYDLETGELVTELDGFANGDFNSDGSRFARATSDGGAVVLDTQTWEPVGDPIPGGELSIQYVEYSPDDQYLLTGDIAGAITLRDPKTLTPTGAPLIGHRSPLGPGPLVVFFSPDNKRLVTMALDGLALWDIEARQQIGDFWPGDRGGATLDGTRAFSFVGDYIVFWDLNTDHWFDIACQAAGRNMTRAEWEEFISADPVNAQFIYHSTCPQWPIEP